MVHVDGKLILAHPEHTALYYTHTLKCSMIKGGEETTTFYIQTH